MSLLFNLLSTLVIAFLPGSNCLLISWLQSPSAVILEPPKIKSLTVSIVSPSVCHEVMRLDAMILVFWILTFKPAFSLSSFTFIKRLFSSSSLSAIRMESSGYLRLLIFPAVILIPDCAWVFTETKATLPGVGVGGGSLTLSVFSWESRVWGQRRTGESWRFHSQIYTLRT